MNTNNFDIPVYFDGLTSNITLGSLSQKQFSIDFSGSLMVLFEKNGNSFIAINAMNGNGINVAEQYYGKKLLFLVDVTPSSLVVMPSDDENYQRARKYYNQLPEPKASQSDIVCAYRNSYKHILSYSLIKKT